MMNRFFGNKTTNTTETSDSKTERVVNIVYPLKDKSLEGYETNSVFRVINPEHEKFLTRERQFAIEAVAVDATPLTCSLNKSLHKHGCYSADD